MTDIFDTASEHEQRLRDQAINNARVQPRRMKANGSCYNCHADIKVGFFCDDDCRDDWQYRNPNK